MARLTRVTNKVFGSTASIVDDPTYGPQIGQFGSAKAGTYNATADVATIQGLPAWNNGWIDAVIPNQQYPTLPEMTGFGKVVTYQTGYILQEGVAEWDAGTTYYKNSIVKYASTTSTQSATASIGDSTGVTSASVNSNTFISQISTDGVYVFSYDGANWLYNGISTSLNIYGVTYEGTAVNGDEITITLSTTITLNDAVLYLSLTDNNINNNPDGDNVNWRIFEYANRDISNLTDAGKIYGSSLGMPSTKYENLTFGASLSTYIMPANGWLTCGIVAWFEGAPNGYYEIALLNSTKGINSTITANTLSGYGAQVYLPVEKGDVVQLRYLNVSPVQFTFIYAIGSESEA